MSKQKRVYATFGSTTLSVPEKMVGYDKQHHLHLWNTITPKTHQLSHHYGKTAINLTTNPNSNRKIQRVPRTTKYMSYENKNVSNGGGGANGQIFKTPAAITPTKIIPPPAPAPAVIPINTITRDEAARRIQATIKRRQSKINLRNQQVIPGLEGRIYREGVRPSLYADEPLFPKKVDESIEDEKQLDNAFDILTNTLKRRNAQRKYNKRIEKKKEQQEKYEAYKTFSRLIKRKEKQRDYISFLENEQQNLRDELNNVYRKVGVLLQEIKTENEITYEGNIPDKVKYKRYLLDMRLNDLLNTALNFLDVLNTKFNENIEVHLYNIDRFKNEINDRIHYTREELDAMSMVYIQTLLKYTNDKSAIIGATRKDIQQYRDVYNAYQRKLRKSTQS